MSWTDRDDAEFDRIVKKTFNIENARYARTLKMGDLDDWDSLGHLTLIFEIEKGLNRKFPLEKIPELDTLEKILFFLKK